MKIELDNLTESKAWRIFDASPSANFEKVGPPESTQIIVICPHCDSHSCHDYKVLVQSYQITALGICGICGKYFQYCC